MKRTIVAILALTPALLVGQTKSPAQPRSTRLLASNLAEPVLGAGGANATAGPAGISTGVTPPKRIHTEEVRLGNVTPWQATRGERTVVISMLVDETGTPAHLQVVKSADELTDRAILTAASQYRYKPGTLNGRPVAVPVEVQYSVQ